jgi:hypothetical protein
MPFLRRVPPAERGHRGSVVQLTTSSADHLRRRGQPRLANGGGDLERYGKELQDAIGSSLRYGNCSVCARQLRRRIQHICLHCAAGIFETAGEFCHSRESGNPEGECWTLVFAGVTTLETRDFASGIYIRQDIERRNNRGESLSAR